ncbi:hypothetical protein SAY87_008616 [Trapa incisa]|uniref:Uncharacterized protein n=1 Tax=Trapa incisa TaxID=236973 RepID=A0AAN7JXX4_9MYRT|nr:hypothetical protein SAY87_008616 [Trapa incisa]
MTTDSHPVEDERLAELLEKAGQIELTVDETSDLLNSYLIVRSNMEAGGILNNQATINTATTTSSSNIEQSKQQLVDDLDSMFSWDDGFDCFEQELFFFQISQS